MLHTSILMFFFSCCALAVPVSLFNGKDLSNWEGDGYLVEDEALTCSTDGSILRSKKQYTNYVLEFLFRLPAGGNNGVGIHYPGEGKPAFSGLEIQLLDDSYQKHKSLKDHQFNGSIYSLKAAKKGLLKKVGEWNHKKIYVWNDEIVVELNGVEITRANLSQISTQNPKHKGLMRRSGYICLCGNGSKVQFKNITIDEGATPNASPAVLPSPTDLEGFKKLYNERDLEGFKVPPGSKGHWQAKGRVLHYDGESTAKDKNLWTEKEYTNFILYCDWRWAGPPTSRKERPVFQPNGEPKKDALGEPIKINTDEYDSGIYIRGNSKSQINIWNWPCGSGEVYGYRTDKNQTPSVRAGVTPSSKADRPIGEWNRFKILVEGNRLTVTLNGEQVISNALLPGMNASGRIALQHHGSMIDFANFYIKELK